MIRTENVSETVALFRVAGLFVLVSFTGPFCLRVVFSWLVERGGRPGAGTDGVSGLSRAEQLNLQTCSLQPVAPASAK